MTGEGLYGLDGLGWLQFEQLCVRLLEFDCAVPASAWREDPVGKHGLWIDDGLALTDGPRLTGPVRVAPVWVTGMGGNPWRDFEGWWGQVMERRPDLAIDRPEGSLLLITNCDAFGANGDIFVGRHGGPWQGTAIGAVGLRWLSARIEARADLRRAMPSLLGLGNHSLHDPAVGERSTFALTQARDLARVFVPTSAYTRTLDVLERHHFVVLTGPPEMGKTAIARTIALAQLTDGWEALECTQPEELWSQRDDARRQVFIADDAFGSTEYQPETAERWAREMSAILRSLDSRHWLVWTSRPAPLRAGLTRIHRERGAGRFPVPGAVLVDASALTVQEKALILLRHAKARGVRDEPREALKRFGYELVTHRHFTPERIRRFVSITLPTVSDGALALGTIIDREIQTPTAAMAASFHALSPEHRALLVALLDVEPGPVEERELAHAIRRHRPQGLTRPPAELIDRLTDHFLRVTATRISWVHPSWRDLVIDELSVDDRMRRAFLSNCELDGALLALSVGGGVAGERELPLLAQDDDWDLLTDRIATLMRSAPEHDVVRALTTLRASLLAIRADPGRRELEALAGAMLDVLRRRWDRAREPLALLPLELWLQVAGELQQPPPVPSLTVTWGELLPSMSASPADPETLRRVDLWLDLVAILDDYDRAALAALGFPSRASEPALAFIERIAALGPGVPAPLVQMLGQIARRLAARFPEHGVVADAVLAYAPWKETGEPWLESLAAGEGTGTDDPRRSERAYVERVLSDL